MRAVRSDLTSLAATTAAGSYEFFDSAGARDSGSISDAGTIAVGTAAQNFTTSLYRQFTVPGDTDLVAANISSGVNVLGVAGNVVLPVATDVRLNIQYGVSGTGLTGSYTGVAVADCTADGNVDCKIPATGPLKAADTTNFSGWDIRTQEAQRRWHYRQDLCGFDNADENLPEPGAHGTLEQHPWRFCANPLSSFLSWSRCLRHHRRLQQ